MLGGQHISAAVRAVYHSKLQDQGLQEDDLPQSQSHVMAEILRPDTPISVAQLAAGQHQRHQSNVKSINTFDIMSMMATECEKNLKSKSTPFMDDNQLYVTLEKMGVVNEERIENSKNKAKGKAKKTESLVCM